MPQALDASTGCAYDTKLGIRETYLSNSRNHESRKLKEPQ